jgi:O-antigen/teichoic acid export membrane protein
MSNRIIINTGLLYFKMAISIVISLYSTRLVLKALGTEDYGIFILIGGIIAMLGFLNTTMASSTQRHLSFSMGKNKIEEVKNIFANSIILHFILGLFLVIVFEVLGLYFLSEKLEIPVDKMETAKILYQFIVFSTFITIIAVPYDGIVNAKENMLFLSITGIFDSLLKLAIALLLFIPFEDKLLWFGVFTLAQTFLVRFVKQMYCLKVYSAECKGPVLRRFDKKIIKDLYSFAGWNLLGVIAYVFRNQGVIVVLNLFYGTVIIAAYGIANQVNAQLRMFSEAMLQSIQPQMIKNEGNGDRERMLKLAIISSKFSFFIFSFFALPIYLELDFIINLWLIDVPESTIIFCRLMIILTLVQQFRTGVTIATHAIGKIKEYQLFNAPLQLLALPLGFLFLKFDYPAYSVIIAIIIIETLVVFLNIIFFKKLTDFSPITYLKTVVIKSLISLSITYLLIYGINYYVLSGLDDLKRVLIIFPLSIIVYPILIYFISLDYFEKLKLKEMFLLLKKRINR